MTRKISYFESSTPLLDRPEMTGQALGQFLEKHQMDGAKVIVGVPAKWVIAQEKDFPPVGLTEATSILRLQAERMSTAETDSLLVDTAGEIQTGSQKVLLVGMLRTQVAKIQKLIEAAKLQLVAICPTALATSALLEADHAMLQIGAGEAEFVQWQNGVARTLRPLASADMNQLSVELSRILAMRTQTGRVRINDGIGLTARDRDALEARIGVQAELVSLQDLNATLDPAAMNGNTLTFRAQSHLPSVALSVMGLDIGNLPVNFINSRLAAEKTRRFGRGTYLGILCAAAVVLGTVALVWTVQSREAEELALSKQIEGEAKEVKAAEASLQRFRVGRAYFENRSGYLDCAKRLAMSFNYNEPIWVTTITLRDGGDGQMQGKSTEQRLILALRDRLMNDRSFANVQLLDLRESGGKGGEIAWSISFIFNSVQVAP